MLASNLAILSADLALRIVVDALQPDATMESRAEIYNLHATIHATHKRGTSLNQTVRTTAALGRDIDNRA